MSLALPPAEFFVGVDWAAEVHAVCVINIEGKVLSQFTVKHSADGIALLVHRLATFGEPIDIPIGIERPDGRLVDLLLEAGHPVVPVSPNAIKTWREGEVLSGAKSDAADAAVIAEYLRLRRHRLTAAAPHSDETKAVRTVVRTRDDLVHLRVAAVNQLAALLDAYWPGANAIFADMESKIALEFLSRYPTPTAAAHLGEKRIAGFCAARGYSGKRPAAELLTRLRAAPAGTTEPHLTVALHDAVLALAGVVKAIHQGLRQTPAVHFRWACNKRFRVAMTTFADSSRHASRWAAKIYNNARAAGKDHPHAVRILARAWIRVIWRCWHDNRPYDPTKYGAAQALNAQSSVNLAA